MGILDRLRHFDDVDQVDELAEPEAPPETAEKVDAILSVLTAYLDPESGISNMLYTIARKELVTADAEKLDVVIQGVLDAADALRPFAPPRPASSLPAAVGDGAQ